MKHIILFLCAVSVLYSCSDKVSNLTQPEVITTESGLQYIEVRVGDGPFPEAGDNVCVHTIGWLEDRTPLLNTYEDNMPICYMVARNRMIMGYEEGVASMRMGGIRLLIIPPELGYGERGFPDIVPPNATLYFRVELVSID